MALSSFWGFQTSRSAESGMKSCSIVPYKKDMEDVRKLYLAEFRKWVLWSTNGKKTITSFQAEYRVRNMEFSVVDILVSSKPADTTNRAQRLAPWKSTNIRHSSRLISWTVNTWFLTCCKCLRTSPWALYTRWRQSNAFSGLTYKWTHTTWSRILETRE